MKIMLKADGLYQRKYISFYGESFSILEKISINIVTINLPLSMDRLRWCWYYTADEFVRQAHRANRSSGDQRLHAQHYRLHT